jgi:Mg2+ and Co2+ transporter CorA
MAFIIIDECSKVFFDRTTPLDHRPEVVDLFSSAISNIAEKKTSAYEDFGNAVSKMTLDRSQIAEKMMRRSLNIGFEWATLVEAQQVIDELQILQGIFAQQISVMADLEKDLGFVNWKAIASRQTESAEDAEEQATLTEHKARDRLSGLAADMQQRRDELKSMEELQTKTRTQLRELLDMKQQQANIIEAKAAIARADESVLQGRSIVVFTVVTIFFLPLSFMTSVFGMNTKEFSEDGSLNLDMTLRWMRM